MRPTIRGLHHDHIDGSRAALDVIEDLNAMSGQKLRYSSHEEWAAFFRDPHHGLVERFAAITGVLQSAEALDLIGYAYGRRRAAEGHRYVEGKFAPQYHTSGGLTMRQATDAMLRGLKRAERECGIRILLQICIGRETDETTGVEIACIALEHEGEIALDLACDEAGHPPEKHFKAYQSTFNSNVKCDCHAGEWVSREPRETYRRRLLENVRTAVYDLRCHGIGHAIPLPDDPELVSYIVDNGVRVSGCPTSNLYCGLIADVRELRIDELLDRGVIYTLNADDDLFMPQADETARVCDDAYGFTAAQCRQLEENVFRGAFADDVRARTA